MEGEEEQLNQAPKVIKAKDLPGAVNVMPAGLGGVLAKRASREVKMEQKENTMTFSSGGQEQTFSSASDSKFQETTATKTQQSTNFSSSSSFQQQSVQKSSFSSSSSGAAASTQVKSILKQPASVKHGEEIQQESLKTTIQSAITDIEQGMDRTDFADKENMAPQQQQLQQQQQQQMLLQQQQQQQQQQEMMRQEQEQQLLFQKQQREEQFRMQQQQEEQLRIQQQQYMEQSASSTTTQNGHFNASDHLKLHEGQRATMRTPHEFKARPESITNVDGLYTPQKLDLPDPTTIGKKEPVQQQQQILVQESHETTINGSHSEETKHHLELNQNQTLGDGSKTLGQIMTPVQDPDYDSNSLKRRNPNQMFTDSAFYSPKYHPSVAEQFEMAHKLSSSIVGDVNKMSKGQEMYLKRAKKSGDEGYVEPELPGKHDGAPNIKLVMNPEGKMHDYSDLPEEEVPDMSQMVMVGNPEIAKTLANNMNECKGRGGELFAKRRKKADKWVVDESQIGMGEHPSLFADEFITQQNMAQQQMHEEKTMEIREKQQIKDEADSQRKAESQEIQQKQQQIFQEQQLMKQQQGQQIIQQQQIRKQSVELPPNFQGCSLKGRPFTPSLDLSIHNVQGIDVWAPRGPKPYGKVSTVSRTTPHAAQQLAPLEQDEPDYQIMKAQMEGHHIQQSLSQTKLQNRSQQDQQLIQQEALLLQQQQQEAMILQQEREEALFLQQQEQEAMFLQQKQQEQEAMFLQQQQQQKQQQEAMMKQKQQEAMFKQQQDAMLKQEQELMLKQQQEAMMLQQQQQEAANAAQAQARHEKEIAEKKRIEYEEWLRAQEMEAYRLEYDCSVKYEEHGASKEEEAPQQTSRLTTNFREEKIEKHQVQTQQVVTKQAPMKEPELPKPKPVEQPKLVEKPRPIEQPKPTPKQQPIPQRDTVDFAKTTQQDVFQNQSSFSSQQKSFSSTTTKQDHSEISMQMKSGGLMHDERQGPTMQINDYVGTLRPTTTGEEIRTPAPDAIYTSNRESVYNEEQLYSQAALRKTQAQKQGVFGGIAGDRNSLLMENPDLDYERHSVGNLVKHFSKIKSADINPQFLPQQYSAMQNSGEAPPLSYLKEQAATRVGKESKETNSSSDYTASTKKVMKETLEIEDAEERLKLFQRRGSLKDYLNIGLEIEDGKQQQQSSTLPSILDPSAILQVDGSIEPGLGKKRAMRDSNGRDNDSQGRLIDTDKWDNHNTIARGWAGSRAEDRIDLGGSEDHYQPVTFRKLYGTKSVAGPSTTPLPMSSKPVVSEQETYSPNDEGYADL